MRHLAFLLLICLTPALGGCFLIKKPDKANIDRRKENQQLRDQVAQLERQAVANAATIRSFRERTGTLPTLPPERLARVITTHDLKIGRLTGGSDFDPGRPGHEGLRVFVTPLDADGDQVKAAGTFKVEAFDPSHGQGAKIGTWTFDLDAARKAWRSVLTRYEYVLPCPWQTPPEGTNLHVEVTFVDELTQRQFTKSIDVTAELPPASGPATTAPAR